jgi:Reverse transcriptase (RNA-dependent DNA polymerase).
MKDSAEFFLRDYSSTLFPLRTNQLLVEKYAVQLKAFIKENIIDAGGSFQNQQRVFATKRGWFLRRTVKLDPVAEFFLYDLVYRNQSLFRASKNKQRAVFGFVIEGGQPVSTLKAYVKFKEGVALNRATYKHYAYFDVASYFNHIYHHDLVRWFEDVGATEPDLSLFGKFLREISSGRSVDCLPQGLYPAKMVGASFLSFLEASNRLRSAQTLRLMDDTWMFDNDPRNLVSDFMLVQALLSDRGLSVNDKKSVVLEGYDAVAEMPADLDQMKIDLLRKRREELRESEGYGDEDEDDDDEDEEEEEDPNTLAELTEEEQEYLVSLLKRDNVQEEDAELVLTLMRENSADLMDFLPSLMAEFPALSKKIYQFCGDAEDKTAITDMILQYLDGSAQVTEFQLFWFGMTAEDHLLKTPKAGELLRALYENDRATSITKAKILEIADKRFGLPDLRDEHLRTGQSDWLAWSAAIGARVHPKGQRNQLLKYFRKSSPMNRLIGEFVEKCF